VDVLGVRRAVAISGKREDRIASIARLQRGRVSRKQLLVVGIADRTIYHLASRGFLRRKHRGVYAVGHTAPAPLADETAALLACGPHAVLSHRTAARMRKLVPEGDTSIHVTIRGRHGARPDGVHVHRTNRLTRSEVEIVEGLPVTSPARTLIDFAGDAALPALERAIEEALIQPIVTERQLRRAAARANGSRGAARVLAVLAAQREPGITRSMAERRFRALIRAAQLPEPRTNFRMHGHSLDAYWPDLGVVVEVQSQKFHLTKAALERDTRKAAKLTAAGLTVSYVTWVQMRDEPYAVVARVAQTLAMAAR
jgi:predicted transcriptional regulator of viral defense system